ncbi:MAG: hypothetical protein UZ08_BCD001001226 [Candidatus Parvibacillus calidus]|nr:MAG: hypothetical protein UZ08_BCD001001226 [Candidatus Parvibacillus calidus]
MVIANRRSEANLISRVIKIGNMPSFEFSRITDYPIDF